MKLNRAFHYRIYPTPSQIVAFERIAGCCRLLYNIGLEQRSTFSRRGRSITYLNQQNELPALKEAFPWIGEVPSQVAQMALRNLDDAFTRFFNGQSGYPKPRKKFEHDSFTFPQNVILDAKSERLVLPSFGKAKKDHGTISVRIHRPTKGKIKSATISRRGTNWFVSILVELQHRRPTEPNWKSAIGIDRGTVVPFAGSDGSFMGQTVETPRMLERQRRLARSVSRTKKGSANRGRALAKLRRHKAKMARRRLDAIHKITTKLAKNHGLIVIEKLRVQNMTASAKGSVDEPGRNVAQKSGLNRSILDKGWGEFRRQIQYKAKWYGSGVVEVPPQYTSQTCSVCGTIDAASRATRDMFECVHCGNVEHADTNAAKEILRRGLVQINLPKDFGCQSVETSGANQSKKRKRSMATPTKVTKSGLELRHAV